MWALSARSISWGERPRDRKVPYEIRVEKIKQMVSVTDLLDRFGVPSGQHLRNGHRTFHCPFHDDSHPSLEVDQDDRTWTCWPCQLKRRDAICLVQMLLFPQELAQRPKDWFDNTLLHIESLFGLSADGAPTDIRAVAEMQALKRRRATVAHENRLNSRVEARSNTFRLALAKIVRKAWGDDLGKMSERIIALYGHLEYLLASGKVASGKGALDSEQYKDWRDTVDDWIETVRRRLSS